ncbi:MAG: GNAT family N-acetyltransferase [Sedimentisphaerales bacterium]|nr:GNAT family N-acetyltransferase [Sedimentisphaerales bacterium]
MTPPKNIPSDIEGERLIIRKLKLSDAKDFYQNIRDKDIVKWTIEIPYPYPKSQATKYIRHAQRMWRQRKEFNFAVVPKTTGRLIGEVRLLNLDWDDRYALLAYWLGVRYWRYNFMTEAAGLALKFGFEHLGLHRVNAYLFDKNIGSRRVMEKNLMQPEGIFRDAWRRYGLWHNKVYYAILEDEFHKYHPFSIKHHGKSH